MKKKHYLQRNTMFKTLLFVLILIKNRHNSNLNHKKNKEKAGLKNPAFPINKFLFTLSQNQLLHKRVIPRHYLNKIHTLNLITQI